MYGAALWECSWVKQGKQGHINCFFNALFKFYKFMQLSIYKKGRDILRSFVPIYWLKLQLFLKQLYLKLKDCTFIIYFTLFTIWSFQIYYFLKHLYVLYKHTHTAFQKIPHEMSQGLWKRIFPSKCLHWLF